VFAGDQITLIASGCMADCHIRANRRSSAVSDRLWKRRRGSVERIGLGVVAYWCHSAIDQLRRRLATRWMRTTRHRRRNHHGIAGNRSSPNFWVGGPWGTTKLLVFELLAVVNCQQVLKVIW